MTFEDWMCSERVTYKPSDDSVEDRALRRCWDAAVAAERELWRAQAARDTVETRWAMREQIAAWLDGQGQPGYATEVRCREWA